MTKEDSRRRPLYHTLRHLGITWRSFGSNLDASGSPNVPSLTTTAAALPRSGLGASALGDAARRSRWGGDAEGPAQSPPRAKASGMPATTARAEAKDAGVRAHSAHRKARTERRSLYHVLRYLGVT